MPHLHSGAAAPNVPPCPDTAEEQRAVLRQQIVTGPLGAQVRQHAEIVFKIASGLPPDAAARFVSRQVGEALGEQRERLRQSLPDNPASQIILELLEEIWSAAYAEAEREFDADPKEIAAAIEANATAWRTLEITIAERAHEAFQELQAIEIAVAVPGVDRRVCAAFTRGVALGRVLGALRVSLDPETGLDVDTLEHEATAIFNRQLETLQSLDAATALGTA